MAEPRPTTEATRPATVLEGGPDATRVLSLDFPAFARRLADHAEPPPDAIASLGAGTSLLRALAHGVNALAGDGGQLAEGLLAVPEGHIEAACDLLVAHAELDEGPYHLAAPDEPRNATREALARGFLDPAAADLAAYLIEAAPACRVPSEHPAGAFL